ncbi:hypothetical protein RCL1_008376 [Eukaryota sp. TZLM3-RCL]
MKASLIGCNKRGVVLAGPSSSGKGTMIQKLKTDYPFFKHSVSHTTRLPRVGEVHGVHYFFVSDDEFNTLEEQGAFIETARVHTYRYGTSYAAVEALITDGFVPLLDIDVQGVRSMRKASLDFLFIFMYAPLDVLKVRLLNRGTETPDTLAVRLQTASKELAILNTEPSLFDEIMLNEGSIDDGYTKLKALIGLR